MTDEWEVSTLDLCRFAYPGVLTIEKKHRVAVLQVLQRLMRNPPRELEDRNWIVGRGRRRGYWMKDYIRSLSLPNPRASTAYHEAGHALACLYFGNQFNRVVVHTDKQMSGIERGSYAGGEIRLGFVEIVDVPADIEDPIRIRQDLVGFLAGPIAQAHYDGKWPHRPRGLSQTYSGYFEGGGRSDAEKIALIVTILSDGPTEAAVIRHRAQELAQALIRSEPGWHFIQLLAERMLTLKEGSLKYRLCASCFREAFGRPPPPPRSWDSHWPPTLAKMRVGWLPP